jgi:hypothetical protein
MIFFLLMMRMVYSSGLIACKCVSRSPTVMSIHATKDTKIFFMRHSPTAETLSFFQQEHSIEAITTAMSRKLSLRQSRLRCSSHNHTRNSWKGKNESLQFYEVQNVLPGKFVGLSNDLLAYWDEHYPSSKFPPPENVESNRVVPRHDFMHDMHYVQELVNVFEHLFEGLEVQLVWFIKKSRRGDGFQRWHQDLVGNGTTAATIVVNIASIVARDELYQIEKIRESHWLIEEVSLGIVEESQQKKGDDQDRDTIGEVGQKCATKS